MATRENEALSKDNEQLRKDIESVPSEQEVLHVVSLLHACGLPFTCLLHSCRMPAAHGCRMPAACRSYACRMPVACFLSSYRASAGRLSHAWCVPVALVLCACAMCLLFAWCMPAGSSIVVFDPGSLIFVRRQQFTRNIALHVCCKYVAGIFLLHVLLITSHVCYDYVVYMSHVCHMYVTDVCCMSVLHLWDGYMHFRCHCMLHVSDHISHQVSDLREAAAFHEMHAEKEGQ